MDGTGFGTARHSHADQLRGTMVLLCLHSARLGSVMNDPAWQAITPELVPREQHASAVAVNSGGIQRGPGVGPALGGSGGGSGGLGTTFSLNAASFSESFCFSIGGNGRRRLRHSAPRVGRRSVTDLPIARKFAGKVGAAGARERSAWRLPPCWR